MIAAIIPAAGRSTRMGTPKALLAFRGATFLQAVVASCSDAGLSPIIVALGGDRDKILSSCALHDVIVVENTDAELGPIGSLAAGIQAVNRSVEGALVWPVDQPHVAPHTVGALVDAFQGSRVSIVVPTFNGIGGHPVLLSRDVFPECLAASEARATLRTVLRADPGRVVRLPVGDRAVVEDIDTPEDYARVFQMSDL